MDTAWQQQVARPGIVELAFGEPDLSLLPSPVIESCTRRALGEHSRAMLAYGTNAGPPHLRHLVQQMVVQREGRDLPLDALAVTGGNSHALTHVLARFVKHEDVVFVEQPTYSLGLRAIADCSMRIESIPIDDDGLVVEELAARIAAVRRAGRRPRLLYTVPTYHNPAGVSLAPDRRARLVELAAAEELLILEDDAYRDLWYEGPPPPSLWSMAPAGVVLRLGSFSKTIAPGLRTGWLTAHPDHVTRYVDCGLFESGGHVSWFSTFVTAQFLAEGHYDAHVALLRDVYARRRDTLLTSLARELPAGCHFTKPAGGFFVRVRLPDGVSAGRLLAVAETHGVSFVPGTRNQITGGDDALRLGFTYYAEDKLKEGATRLAAALDTLMREL